MPTLAPTYAPAPTHLRLRTCAYALAPTHLRFCRYPILFGVASILNGEITPREGLVALMEKYPLRLETFPF